MDKHLFGLQNFTSEKLSMMKSCKRWKMIEGYGIQVEQMENREFEQREFGGADVTIPRLCSF